MKPPHLPRAKIGLLVGLLLLSSVPLFSLPEKRPVRGEPSPDFHELLHFALLNASVRYESPAEIEARWGKTYDSLDVVEIPSTDNRYLIGTIDSRRIQDIAVRGTTNFLNFLYDLRFLKHHSRRLGINVHHGFELMADALLKSIEPHLRRGYALRISGQSLGAAEALILAMLLSREGYEVKRVITFGQPKVTDAEGAARYSYLPLLRVVDQNDPITLLPPASLAYKQAPYVQFGDEVDLLAGPYYATADPAHATDPIPPRLVTSLTIATFHTLLREHNIESYVRNLRAKVADAVLVPYAERESFVSPEFRY